MSSFKPEGYTAVSPYFIVPDAPRFIALMKEVFSAAELRQYQDADGRVMHMEMRIDDSVIMLGQASEAFPAMPLCIHVYVEDPDAVYARALAAGCAGIKAPIRQSDDDDYRGTFTDYAGNLWSVASASG